MAAVAVALALFVGAGLGSARAQGGPAIDGTQIVNQFPTYLTFSAIVSGAAAPVQEAVLLYRVPPEGSRTRAAGEVTQGDIPRLVVDVPVNSATTYIPVGADIVWSWEVTLTDGTAITSAEQTFRYEDPRYEWQSIQEGALIVHYYADEDAARRLLEVGAEAVARMSALLGITLDFPIRLYLWRIPQDAGGVEQIESQAFEQVIETGGSRVLADLVHIFDPTRWVVAHEATHVLTKIAGEGGIGRIPAWLDEGTATYAEGDWASRRGFAVDIAIANDDLLSVNSLSSSPGDPSRIEQFYGQSAALVQFLIDEYGPEQFAQLFAVFKEGSTVDNALQTVYAFDTGGLDDAYRVSVGLGPRERGEDRSTRIEDEGIATPAPTEPAPAPTEAAPAAPEAEAAPAAPEAEAAPAPAAAGETESERTSEEIAERTAEIQRRQETRRLPADFGGGGFPWAEVLVGVGGGAVAAGALLLLLLIGRRPMPALAPSGGAVALPSLPMPPPPIDLSAEPPSDALPEEPSGFQRPDSPSPPADRPDSGDG